VRFSRHSSRDGLHFAALEAGIAQRAVIEVSKRVIDSPRLLTLQVARLRSACACTGCPRGVSTGLQTISAGVEVRDRKSGKTSIVSCSERPRFYIFELQGLVPCDPETPIGTACVK